MSKNINVLLKPASQKCNIACKYCFYHDLAANREIEDYGKMQENSVRNIIQKALDFSQGGTISFVFQGGEPTLVGLAYYQAFLQIVKELNNNNSKVFYSLQTNGMLITPQWAKFFKENNFLIGVSVDGQQQLHDLNRIDYQQRGTYPAVMKGIEHLKAAKVAFNILCVVTKATVAEITNILDDFQAKGFKHLQFIPVLDGYQEANPSAYSLTAAEYGQFLQQAFTHYYNSYLTGNYYSERFFDNILGMYLGAEPESCIQRGTCSIQFVIEGNGDVYPCDFFVVNDFKLGNINAQNFEELFTTEIAQKFLKDSFFIHEDCRKCPHLNLCRGGCRRYKEQMSNEGKNIYCQSFYQFFETTQKAWQELAVSVQQNLR